MSDKKYWDHRVMVTLFAFSEGGVVQYFLTKSSTVTLYDTHSVNSKGGLDGWRSECVAFFLSSHCTYVPMIQFLDYSFTTDFIRIVIPEPLSEKSSIISLNIEVIHICVYIYIKLFCKLKCYNSPTKCVIMGNKIH